MLTLIHRTEPCILQVEVITSSISIRSLATIAGRNLNLHHAPMHWNLKMGVYRRRS